jgi:hypothetical protein
MGKPHRTADDDDLMIAASYASFFHWRKVGDAANHAIGQWQLSRVHALLGVPERAIHHAKRCLSLCQDHGLGEFHIASAYEALARAHAVAGDEHWARRFHQLGVQALASISDEADRRIVEADLGSIPGISPTPA